MAEDSNAATSAVSWDSLVPLQRSLYACGVTLIVISIVVRGSALRGPARECVQPRSTREHRIVRVPRCRNSQAIWSTFEYVTAILAIAAGAVLVDSFVTLERMKGKLGGTVGCGGARADGFMCCGAEGRGTVCLAGGRGCRASVASGHATAARHALDPTA